MRLLRAYAALFRATLAAFRIQRVRALLLVCALIALTEAVIMSRIEGWSFLDSFYFSVVSMSTVGYGEPAPVTPLGKICTIVFLVVGIGVFVLAVSTVAQSILREFERIDRRLKTEPADTIPPPAPKRGRAVPEQKGD
jgi:voltage-gated potassium channel